MNDVLANLGLQAVNPGTWSSSGGWLSDPAAKRIDSINPATGKVIASVLATTPAQYEQVMAAAHENAVREEDVYLIKGATFLLLDTPNRQNSGVGCDVSHSGTQGFFVGLGEHEGDRASSMLPSFSFF